MQRENSERVLVRCIGVLFFSVFFLVVSLICLFFVPSKSINPIGDTVINETEIASLPSLENNLEQDLPGLSNQKGNTDNLDFLARKMESADESYKISVPTHSQKMDSGLELYRSVHSRAAVEWFYTNVTESRDVACAILESADKNDIPVALAFALAYTESRYKVTAINKNKNASIDRGLFQLNNKSFPALEEKDFFDPYVSAKYGMSHLRHCLDTAGNEVSALAMYNAGTNRVRNNETPQITLNYVSKIINYRQNLEALFETEVAQFYSNGTNLFLASSDIKNY